jgi:hypothetical protein
VNATELTFAETLEWLAEREGRDVVVRMDFISLAGRLGAVTFGDGDELEPVREIVPVEECPLHGWDLADCDCEALRPIARFPVGDASWFEFGAASFAGATPLVVPRFDHDGLSILVDTTKIGVSTPWQDRGP